MILSAFAEVLLPVTLVIALGYALARVFPLDGRTLNRLSLYILSPCLVFVTLLRTDISGSTLALLVLQMLLVMLATTLCAMLAASFFHLSGPRRSGMLLTSTFMNSGNYGLSVTRYAFGDTGFQYGVIGYLTQTILSQTLAVYLASAGSQGRRAALGQVFRVPLIYGVLLALALRAFGIPLDDSNGVVAASVYRGLRQLADAALPLLLLNLGTQLAKRQPLTVGGPLVAATIIRLLLPIPLAYGAGLLLGLQGLPLYVGTMQAAMPTAVNMVVLAIEFDAWPEFVSSGVVVTTLGSLITLSALLVLFR
jgi:predicted permease